MNVVRGITPGQRRCGDVLVIETAIDEFKRQKTAVVIRSADLLIIIIGCTPFLRVEGY